ncbi:MAG: hypothetical protein SGBAC_012490 [Bacillariaceae sp.]
MPPAILTRLSQSLRKQQKSITCHSDAKRQAEGETCPICWKNLPKKPQCLPCGHDFCKGCILDLKEHAKSTHAIPKCPICRGPLEQESFKNVYKRACYHEHIAATLLGLGSLGDNSLSFLTHEIIREYGLAAKKLDECLRILDAEAMKVGAAHHATSNTTNTTNTTTISSKGQGQGKSKSKSKSKSKKEESKHKQYKVATLMKLQHVLRYHILPETQYKRRINLLKEAILLSSKPIPEAHLELGKIFLLDHQNSAVDDNDDDDDDYSEDDHRTNELAICEFQTILKLAEQSRLTSGAKSAKKLRGKAHYQMARACFDEDMLQEAANHYEVAHKYKSCLDYYMAAKCFSLTGNLPKAISFGKLALQKEEEDSDEQQQHQHQHQHHHHQRNNDDRKCETHLLLLSIYEKFFLVEQLEGHLTDSKHYKYHQDIEQYCSSLIKAKNLASSSQDRSELYLRMDTLQGLIPWKLATIQEHFPKSIRSSSPNNNPSCGRSGRSAAFTEEYSPSETNTYEMGEMEDSLYSNSLYSNSFDYANDGEGDGDGEFSEDGDCSDHDDSDGESYDSEDYESNDGEMKSKDNHSELLSDDDTGDWTNETSLDVQSVDPMEDDCSYHENDDEEEDLDDNLKMPDDSEPETDDSIRDEDIALADNLKMQDDSEPETNDDNIQEEGMDDSGENHLEMLQDDDSEPETNDDNNAEAEQRCAMQEPETDDDDANDNTNGNVKIEEGMESSAESDHDTADDQDVDLEMHDEDGQDQLLGAATDDVNQLLDLAADDDQDLFSEDENEEIHEDDDKDDPKPDLADDMKDPSGVTMEEEETTSEVSLIEEEDEGMQ